MTVTLFMYSGSAFDRACRHARNDLPLEEHEHDERQNGNDNHIGKKQVPLRAELAHEAEERQLGSDIFVTRQEVKRPDEVVIDANRGGDDHSDNGWL